jgi:hypothetical protein
MLFASTGAWAQVGSTAQISGTVRDDSGGVLPGVDVTVTQTATGFTRSTVTDSAGGYVLTNLPIGPYRFQASLSGFKTFEQTGIVLQVGSSPTLNVTLGLGQLSETVSVQAAAPLVDTQRSGIGQVIENARIMDLPLNGRNPTDLIELAGAAVHVASDDASTRSFQGSSGGKGIAIAGGQTFGTAYMLDGAMHNNPYDNLNLPLPFPDALQEFRVETGALGAGSGVHAGGSVNAVTKSGTNQYHGDAFEFWRNHRFNAINPFAAVVNGKQQDDGLNRNQTGGTVGGPIIQNKLFFFGGYQGTFTRQTPSSNIAFVPTPAMLAGDFSQVSSAACNGGRAVTLRGPFVNNRVNPALLSPAALKIASKLPATTDPCGQVTYGRAANINEGQEVGRVDYQISQQHQFFGRYISTKFTTPPALASSDNLLTSVFGGFDNLGQSLTAGENWVISANTLNSVRFAWNNTKVHRTNADYFDGPAVGINMYSYVPNYFILGVSGAFNIGSGVNNEARFDTTTWQVDDDVTLIRGAHQMGFGANLARWNSFSQANVRSPGTFVVTNQTTGLALADFLMGDVQRYIQSNPNQLDMYEYYMALYGQDTWRMNSRMTLNYGVRWEPFFPQQLPNGYIYNFSLAGFNQGVRSTVFKNAPPGFSYPGDAGFVGGKSGMNKQWKNVAPRVGFGWDPTGDGRTSIRGGYSIGYDFYNAQYHLNTSNAPPWGSEVRVNATSLDNPFAGFPGGNPFPRSFDANSVFTPFGPFLALDPNAENPRQQNWNVAVQRQIGSNMAVSVTYLGNHADHLWNMKALNPGVFLGLGPCTLNTAKGPQFYPVCSTQQNLDQRRVLSLEDPIDAQYIGGLDLHDASGHQNYNGLLLAFQRRSAAGLSVDANYTLSKCLGTPTQSLPNIGTGWTDPNNPDYDYGPCLSDRRHLFNGTLGYQTPQLNGLAGAIASDWRVSGILHTESGAPLTVFTGQDRSMTGVGVGSGQRADLIGGASGYGAKTVSQWLDRNAFAQPALGTLGDSPRGGWRGPSRWNIDMVVARLFRFGSGQQIEARLEAFNVTNHYNYADPVTNLSAATFGKILALAPGMEPRVLQFGLKYTF